MRPLIEFAELDLRGAFDFAIMMEEDAQGCYARLARLIGSDPGGAGDIFRKMVGCEAQHARELTERRDVLFRAEQPQIAVSVLDAAVERPEVEDDELPRTAREALEVSLAAEKRAVDFYTRVLPHSSNPGVRAFFQGLIRDEAGHAALLERAIAEQPEPTTSGDRGGPPAGEVPPQPAESYPDAAELASVIPRFDAATRAVARGVVVYGMRQDEVAAELGVSRRTVSRKLRAFLTIAHKQIAAALIVATLVGCVAELPRTTTRGEPDLRPTISHAMPDQGAAAGLMDGAAISHALPDRVEGAARAARGEADPPPKLGREDRTEVARQVYAQVAGRMRHHDARVHRNVARTIVAEAAAAHLDPMLVLALIHVESSFNPSIVSSAGAVGLMQLLVPTMRREIERSGLPPADPADPVANVQAGVRYLKRLISAFGGVDNALMAYNAGPNRIRGHLKRGAIPSRFHVYPQRIRGELERLRVVYASAPSGPSGATAMLSKGPSTVSRG